ncbi:hypothetical protein [Mesorhizobium sp. 43Arga]
MKLLGDAFLMPMVAFGFTWRCEQSPQNRLPGRGRTLQHVSPVKDRKKRMLTNQSNPLGRLDRTEAAMASAAIEARGPRA